MWICTVTELDRLAVERSRQLFKCINTIIHFSRASSPGFQDGRELTRYSLCENPSKTHCAKIFVTHPKRLLPLAEDSWPPSGGSLPEGPGPLGSSHYIRP